MKPMPSLRRRHGWALIVRERVTMTIPSLVHAGSVIEPAWVPSLADASKKDTAVKSARACDGPSAIHSAELLAATADIWVVENCCVPTVRVSVKAVPVAATSADTVSPGLMLRGITLLEVNPSIPTQKEAICS